MWWRNRIFCCVSYGFISHMPKQTKWRVACWMDIIISGLSENLTVLYNWFFYYLKLGIHQRFVVMHALSGFIFLCFHMKFLVLGFTSKKKIELNLQEEVDLWLSHEEKANLNMCVPLDMKMMEFKGRLK